jgi:hypothetical protein
MMSAVKRVLVVLLAGLAMTAGLLLSAGEARAQGLVVSESEPNDTLARANVLPLPSLTVTGRTDVQGDLDYFQTTLTEGIAIRVTLSGMMTNFDGRVQILNGAGEVVGELARTDTPPGNAAEMTLTVPIGAVPPPATGYVRVSNDTQPTTSNESFTAAYTLSVSQGVPEEESNDTPAEAQALNEDFPIVGDYPAREDITDPNNPDNPDNVYITDDWFAFTTTEPDESILLSFEYSLGVNIIMAIALQNEAGELIAEEQRTNISGSGGGKNPSMVLTLPEPGNYFVRVYNAGEVPIDNIVVIYSIFYEKRQGTFETESNQSFRESTLVTVAAGSEGTVVGGFLQIAQDVDIFRVVVPPGLMLVADVDLVSDVPVADGVASTFLEEELGVAFASNDNSSELPAGASFSLVNFDPYVRVLPRRSGVVYVGVADRTNRGSAIGFEYRLHLKFETPPVSEGEPNDAPGTERRLVSGEITRGTIGTDGDVDGFIFEGRTGDVLLVNLNAFGIGSFLDARVTLLDPDGQVLRDQSQSPFGPDPFILVPSLPRDGDYVAQVRARQGAAGFGASYYYELTQVSSPPSLQTAVRNPDINRSDRVDGFDLADLSRRFGTNLGDADFDLAADLFPSNSIDGDDLVVLANFFGADLPFPGLSEIIPDSVGDALPFFGPASKAMDLAGVASSVSGSALELSFFYVDPVESDTGGVLSLDVDASSLTGSQGTPDAYVATRNLGSELEIFFTNEVLQVFRIPDPRTDIYPAFVANVGDLTAATFPKPLGLRRQPLPEVVFTGPSTSSGNSISFQLDTALLGGSTTPTAAALATNVSAVEPTDRLPNQGKVALQPPFEVTSITVTQKVCDDDPQTLCVSDGDCAGTCVDADLAAPDPVGGSSALPDNRICYLRTPDGGPRYTEAERGISRSWLSLIDTGQNKASNDTLDKIFPFGTDPKSATESTFAWFTRDMLYNGGYRDAWFDPHALAGVDPPDIDLYYFLGGEGDRAIVDVTTFNQGASFDSEIQLFFTPLNISALDPSTPEALLGVDPDSLVLVASADDKGATDLDPRLETTLSATGIYVVRISGAEKWASCCPPAPTHYTLFHESLRPDEVSIPIVLRGNYPPSVSGLNFELQYDPAVIQMSGFDLARGLRVFQNPLIFLSSAQEMVAEPVAGEPGRIRFAFRSFRNNAFKNTNGLRTPDPTPATELQPRCVFGATDYMCPEIPVARLRFRAVGPGTTDILYIPNPTTPGEPLINLGLEELDNGPIWQPLNGYGPGVTVTVTGITP